MTPTAVADVPAQGSEPAGHQRRLVVCADDYALNAGVSAAVVDLARRQRLNATSVMVLSPRWTEDAAALRALRGHIDVGLHLDWTSDFARAAGHGAALTSLMRGAAWRTLVPASARTQAAVRAVIERQLDAFEVQWRAAPDHVDGHQHVQQFAGIREVLVSVLQRRYGAPGAARPWLRVSRVAQVGVKASAISAWGAQALQDWARANSWPHVAPLLGAYNFDPGASTYARHMAQWLAQMPAQATLMCHPANALDARDPIAPARVREHAYLRSDAFADALAQAGVQLCRGRDALAPSTEAP